ncbi:hypothetical protein OG716_09710 [Nocardia sp. NBC_01388]
MTEVHYCTAGFAVGDRVRGMTDWRGHALTTDEGWREVAEYGLDWQGLYAVRNLCSADGQSSG